MKVTKLFLIPPLVFVSIFIIYPVAEMIYLSFTTWTGFTPPRFIGLRNYDFLLKDPIFNVALINNFVWVIVFLVVNNFLGLMLAGAIDILGRRTGMFFRTAIYISVLLPNAVISLLFVALYDPNIGLIDSFFNTIGLTALGSTQ